MAYVGPQIAHTGGLLLRLAAYLWGEGGRWLRIAIFVAAGAFFLILGAALTGMPALVALTALAPLVAILLVPARINPLWLLAIAVWPDRILVNEKRRILPQGIPLGGDELRRGVRWVFAFVAVEVGMAFYYAGVEYLAPSVDRTLVLVTFALFILLALVAASPIGKLRTRMMQILTIVFVVLTVILLFGGKNEFGNKLDAISEKAKAGPAEVVPPATAGSFVNLKLPPDGGPSRAIFLRPGWHYDFQSAPTGTQVCFERDVCGPLTRQWGVKSGRMWFSRAGGGQVTVRVTPPTAATY